MLGKVISHYRILERLGHGGMGVVYRAEDVRLGRSVALKFLPEDLSGDSQALERFKREARAASALNHPNICTIHDVGEEDGEFFIAMELLEGSSLQQRIAKGALPNAEILELGLELADALDAAHARGIIHRDIKPSNIFITERGRAKILDFGLASRIRQHSKVSGGAAVSLSATAALNDEHLTSPGTAVGTIAYMSPEQARGEELDARSDLFSLGAVLYEACTGRPPFSGTTSALIFDGILRQDPAPLYRFNPDLLPGLEHVVSKALEKDREVRYQSAAELRADLKRLRRDSESGKATAATRIGVAPRRHSWIYVAAALLILVAGVAAYFWRSATPRVGTEASWMPLTNFSDSAVSPAVSPDGRMLAFIRGSDTFFGPGQIYVKFLPDGDPVQLTHDQLPKMSPQFSPDGSRIIYTVVSNGWDTWEVPVLGGEPRLMLPNAEGMTYVDGQHLLFSEIKKGIHMAVVTASESRTDSHDIYVPPRDRGMAHRSALSPDQKWVLVVEMDNGGWLPCRLVPFDGSSAGKAVGPPDAGCTYAAWSTDGKWMYFSADAGGSFHIWRQRFPDGPPQQVTSAATQEEGIAFTPDGRSLITSVGFAESTVSVHEANGERQISSQGYAESPRLSSDGKNLYYLVRSNGPTSHFVQGELWRADLQSGQNQRLLPGFQVTGFDISPDGKRLVFSALDKQGRPRLWLSSFDLRSSPRQLPSAVDEDEPNFGPGGFLYFRAAEGGSNFLYRVKEDGSGREKALPDPVLEFNSISPYGQWAAVFRGIRQDQNSPFGLEAVPLQTGAPVQICTGFCIAEWSPGGAVFAIYMEGTGQAKTILVPVSPGAELPKLPPQGIQTKAELASIKGAKVLDGFVAPGPNLNTYAALQRTVHRNLYRIPLQ
jgi:serine/threonine protein kinase/WD40 repeat protein